MPSMDDLLLYCAKMSEKKFPKATVTGTGEHLRREAIELDKALSEDGDMLDALEEVADTFVLASQQWRFFRQRHPEFADISWLQAAFKQKIKKVEARAYREPDEHGVIEHVREEL